MNKNQNITFILSGPGELLFQSVPHPGFLGEVVYVFDAWGIFALDRELHILWENRDLAVDVVLPEDMPDDHTLNIS